MFSKEMKVACVGIQVMNMHILNALKLSYKFKLFSLFFCKGILLSCREQTGSLSMLSMGVNKDIFISSKIQPIQTVSELE